MIVPVWLLLVALAAVVAAVHIAYRIGYLMGEETGFVQGQTREAEDMLDRLRDVMDARGISLPSDVDTVREGRASDMRTLGRIGSSGKAVIDEVAQ